MMGTPAEAAAAGGVPQPRPQKATFSGMTAIVGVVALVVDIISVAVPHWGHYEPQSAYYSQDRGGKIIIEIPSFRFITFINQLINYQAKKVLKILGILSSFWQSMSSLKPVPHNELYNESCGTSAQR